MNPKLPIALREKYRLVHVPGHRRCHDWVQAVAARIAQGIPAEQAGLMGAQEVFPYEAGRSARSQSTPVDELLRYGEAGDSEGEGN